MRRPKLARLLALLVALPAAASELTLVQLQGSWRVADSASGVSAGAVKIRDLTVTAAGPADQRAPFLSVSGNGSSKIEILPESRLLILNGSAAGGLETGVLCKVDVTAGGLLLRSGSSVWSLMPLPDADVKAGNETRTASGPRPVIANQPGTRPTISNQLGSANLVPVAIDPKWSKFGTYLQRQMDSVQVQWERSLIESRSNPPSGSTVAVRFVLDSDGKIARIVSVDNQSNEQAGRICVIAITDRAPYGPWTDDMKAVLGAQQELTFRFFYQ